MPERKILPGFVSKDGYDRHADVVQNVEEIRVLMHANLEEAIAIKNRVFQTICMFSILDSLVQEYSNYEVRHQKEHFCNFVKKYQNKLDYLEKVEPITLYYDVENQIEMVIKNNKQYDRYLEKLRTSETLSIKNFHNLDNEMIVKVLTSTKASNLLDYYENIFGKKNRENLEQAHKMIELLYKMRSKLVHEMSHLGGENKWDIESGKEEPFYRDLGRFYDHESSPVTDNVYELVIPNMFIFNLVSNCVDNYLDECKMKERYPFENNHDFKRPVDITWSEKLFVNL